MRDSTLAWISLTVWLGSFALSFGLTYLPCYSAICVEQHFPYNTRLHLLSFYCSVTGYFLVFIWRANSRTLRDALGTLVSTRPIPFTSTRVSWGGLLVSIGALGFTGASQGYFWEDQLQFYRERAINEAGTTLGTTRLALVGSTAHMTDLLLGLIVIPVSRDGILNRVFGFHVSTLLRFHKLIGYLFFLTVLIHMVPFYAWVPVFAKAEEPLKLVFGIDNPTVSQEYLEDPAHYFYATVLASGVVSLIIFIFIIVTSLPKLRRKSYNTFYYTHMFSIPFFILLGLHASTDFYMLLPGLILWLVDWVVRLRGLGTIVDAKLQREQNGWFRLTVSTADLPRSTLSQLAVTENLPLKHFYLNVPAISNWQNHPFTTASDLAGLDPDTPSDIVWLFRVSSLGKKEKKQVREWTVKLAALLGSSASSRDLAPTTAENATDEERDLAITINSSPSAATTPSLQTLPIKLRLEGPYTTPHSPFPTHTHILAIVGGTGITGALSLAARFTALASPPSSKTPHSTPNPPTTTTLTILWSVRAAEAADLHDVRTVTAHAAARGADLRLVRHVTGAGRPRVDFAAEIARFADGFGPAVTGGVSGAGGRIGEGGEKEGKGGRAGLMDRRGWVYFSGPSAFMRDGEAACVAERLRRRWGEGGRLEWYCAKWDV